MTLLGSRHWGRAEAPSLRRVAIRRPWFLLQMRWAPSEGPTEDPMSSVPVLSIPTDTCTEVESQPLRLQQSLTVSIVSIPQAETSHHVIHTNFTGRSLSSGQ